MKKDWLKILLVLALIICCGGTLSCRQNDDSPDSTSSLDVFGLTDETQDAAQIVDKANEELKKIKAIYKESEGQTEELKAAMKNNDVAKVKEIASALADKIDQGMSLAKDAVSKIEEARKLKINDTYREYLELKASSLKKQIDAFEFRFEAAKFLRDKFGAKDKQEIETAKAVLKETDENFQKYMEAARETSIEANKIAKESVRKKAE
jgi:hypothetical protein